MTPEEVKKLVEGSGLKVGEIEKKLKVAQSMLSKVIKGERTLPANKINQLKKICKPAASTKNVTPPNPPIKSAIDIMDGNHIKPDTKVILDKEDLGESDPDNALNPEQQSALDAILPIIPTNPEFLDESGRPTNKASDESKPTEVSLTPGSFLQTAQGLTDEEKTNLTQYLGVWIDLNVIESLAIDQKTTPDRLIRSLYDMGIVLASSNKQTEEKIEEELLCTAIGYKVNAICEERKISIEEFFENEQNNHLNRVAEKSQEPDKSSSINLYYGENKTHPKPDQSLNELLPGI